MKNTKFKAVGKCVPPVCLFGSGRPGRLVRCGMCQASGNEQATEYGYGDESHNMGNFDLTVFKHLYACRVYIPIFVGS